MGKKLIIISFILSLVYAVNVYMTRQRTSIREKSEAETLKEPRLIFEDFTLYRYSDDVMESKMGAKLAELYEPNRLELDGDVFAQKLGLPERQALNSESATILFNSKGLTGMTEGAKLVSAEVSGFVEVNFKEHVITTDYAKFVAKDNIIKSSRPVRVDGAGRVFATEDGFNYNLTKESLNLIGLVKGQLRPDLMKKRK